MPLGCLVLTGELTREQMLEELRYIVSEFQRGRAWRLVVLEMRSENRCQAQDNARIRVKLPIGCLIRQLVPIEGSEQTVDGSNVTYSGRHPFRSL